MERKTYWKILFLVGIMILFAIMLCPIKVNAADTVIPSTGTERDIENEKTLIRVAATQCIAENLATDISNYVENLKTKMERYLGTGKVTTESSIDETAILVTYVDSGRQYVLLKDSIIISEKVILTFDPNGGTVTTTSKEVTIGQTYGTLPTPTRTGYTFAGWYTESVGGNRKISTDKYDFAGSSTLYAHWTANVYTVTFNGNGGTVAQASKQVSYGSAYGTLPTATRTGYYFAGWYTAASGGYLVDETTIYLTTANTTLYAHWTSGTYQLTLNANGGTIDGEASKIIQINYGSIYGNLPEPIRTGYTFNGWYTTASGGTKITAETTYKTAGNSTIYAHWTANAYTVYFDGNGGSPSQTKKTVTYGGTYGTLATATREGYDFKGWYTEASGGTKIETTTIYKNVGDITLYAHWEDTTAPTITVQTVITYNMRSGDTAAELTGIENVIGKRYAFNNEKFVIKMIPDEHVQSIQYKISKQAPGNNVNYDTLTSFVKKSDTWTGINKKETARGEQVLESEGTYYLYIKAVDDSGNVGYTVKVADDSDNITENVEGVEIPVCNSYQKFVLRAYYNALGRVPDKNGFNSWLTKLNGYIQKGDFSDCNIEWSSLNSNIQNSRTAKAQVAIMYGMLFSDEAKGKTNDAWVETVYRTVFYRDSDAGGAAEWKKQLNSGATTRINMFIGFCNTSAETKFTNAIYGLN